jgi:hypothetical protein
MQQSQEEERGCPYIKLPSLFPHHTREVEEEEKEKHAKERRRESSSW